MNAGDGSVVANCEYGPFGEPIRVTGTLATANPFRFSTKYTDDESDLLYYGYRYLSASTGRWQNRDPFGEPGFELLQDGAPDVLGDGPNLYCFVENDPIGGYDFLGLKSRCDNDTDCMRCLLFHEGRGKNNKCL